MCYYCGENVNSDLEACEKCGQPPLVRPISKKLGANFDGSKVGMRSRQSKVRNQKSWLLFLGVLLIVGLVYLTTSTLSDQATSGSYAVASDKATIRPEIDADLTKDCLRYQLEYRKAASSGRFDLLIFSEWAAFTGQPIPPSGRLLENKIVSATMTQLWENLSTSWGEGKFGDYESALVEIQYLCLISAAVDIGAK